MSTRQSPMGTSPSRKRKRKLGSKHRSLQIMESETCQVGDKIIILPHS